MCWRIWNLARQKKQVSFYCFFLLWMPILTETEIWLFYSKVPNFFLKKLIWFFFFLIFWRIILVIDWVRLWSQSCFDSQVNVFVLFILVYSLFSSFNLFNVFLFFCNWILKKNNYNKKMRDRWTMNIAFELFDWSCTLCLWFSSMG